MARCSLPLCVATCQIVAGILLTNTTLVASLGLQTNTLRAHVHALGIFAAGLRVARSVDDAWAHRGPMPNCVLQAYAAPASAWRIRTAVTDRPMRPP